MNARISRAWQYLGKFVHAPRQVLLNPVTTPCGNLNVWSVSRATTSGLTPSVRAIASTQCLFGSGTPDSKLPPPDTARGATADLTDVYHPENVDVTVADKQMQIMHPGFRDFGGLLRFSGPASTVKCFENNPLVRKALEEPGNGRVLVVDGGASMRCALLGDNLAQMGAENGWKGVIVNGCIRDSDDISRMPIGVKALNTHPLKSSKRDPGLRDVPVTFAGVTVTPGDWVYADKDGVLVSPKELTL
eukprot:CAMPEP_0118931124 /NCGR_PEP_ID=MMETSP1169-20130426/7572_1 /TAXON_ID=36882 /ORGANISM="Pyramimonas obovata, Strain CCMP722" /LENGTH=245 /DNA_ID=CAMNT_0006873585 /DNA_START=30 /DNA_END=767 /DNA_ORIENTATION=-